MKAQLLKTLFTEWLKKNKKVGTIFNNTERKYGSFIFDLTQCNSVKYVRFSFFNVTIPYIQAQVIKFFLNV